MVLLVLALHLTLPAIARAGFDGDGILDTAPAGGLYLLTRTYDGLAILRLIRRIINTISLASAKGFALPSYLHATKLQEKKYTCMLI